MKRNSMRIVGTFALAASSLVASYALAEAGWARSGGGTGPYGRTWSSSGSGHCAGGTCSSQQVFTGPRGGVRTRNGTTSCGGGICNRSSTVTYPGGRTRTRNSTWTRY